MWGNVKYIVAEIDGLPSAIMFPAHIGHADMARSLSLSATDVLAGGFVQINAAGHYCPYGTSVSLNTCTNDEAHIAFRALNCP